MDNFKMPRRGNRIKIQILSSLFHLIKSKPKCAICMLHGLSSVGRDVWMFQVAHVSPPVREQPCLAPLQNDWYVWPRLSLSSISSIIKKVTKLTVPFSVVTQPNDCLICLCLFVNLHRAWQQHLERVFKVDLLRVEMSNRPGRIVLGRGW